jgi:hypothetical protein
VILRWRRPNGSLVADLGQRVHARERRSSR